MKAWVIWSKITNAYMQNLLYISLALLRISCSVGKVIMTVSISVALHSLFFCSCLVSFAIDDLLYCIVSSFLFFEVFPFSIYELWFSISSLSTPPPSHPPAAEYLVFGQWLGTISKTVIFGQESSLPRISNYFLWTGTDISTPFLIKEA